MPNSYNNAMVLDQLKYLGMLDIIRIRREGYPVHFTFDDFVSKYRCLTKQNRLHPIKDQIVAVISKFDVKNSEWQIGKNKIFLRSHAYEPLEDARIKVINCMALILQRTWKRSVALKNYRRVRNAVLTIQHAYKGWKLRIKFLRMRRSAIIIQSHLRGVFAREVSNIFLF